MPKFSSKRRVRHTAQQMFDLVADVERYPEFVPLCRALKIRQRTPKPDGTEIVIADMTVSFKLVREGFTSRVTLDRPNLKILVEYLQEPDAGDVDGNDVRHRVSAVRGGVREARRCDLWKARCGNQDVILRCALLRAGHRQFILRGSPKTARTLRMTTPGCLTHAAVAGA